MVVIAVLSGLSLLGSAILLPYFLLRLPDDYFIATARPFSGRRPFKSLARNIAGLVLILIGVVLLVLPGQGVLTMLAGLLVCDFGGKKKLLLKAIRALKLATKLNHYRERHGRSPFIGL